MAVTIESGYPREWDRAPPIGIDFGTTNASAAVYMKNGSVIYRDGVCINPGYNVSLFTIAEDQENQETANCVAFKEWKTLIGDAAKSRVILNPENSIFEVKRMIGRKFDDPEIQQDMLNWQFKVVNVEGMLKIHAEVLDEIKTFTPEEIIAILLYKVKEAWEGNFYGELEVAGTVISVPACFNESQRQAMKNAAHIADLDVMLINEPTAAALAYGLREKLKGDKNVLIFDLGGGTVDASVINIKDGVRYEVKSTAGYSHLGGEDFDNVLVAHFAKEFRTKHRKDLQAYPRGIRRLRNACEAAKRTLSSCSEATIDVKGEGIAYHSKLTRAQFEDMCMDLFQSTLKPVERALSDAGMAKGSIDEVVLVGGSTNIPKIRELLTDFFDGKEPLSIFPDAVAVGTAVFAAMACGVEDKMLSTISVVDITPYSLGIETDKGKMSPIFKRNSQIPCKTTKVFSTDVDNQSSIDVDVYEGEQAMAKDNRLVGRFTIENVPPAPKGVPQIEVRIELSAAGILLVDVADVPGVDVQPSLVNNLGMPDDDVSRMRQDARRLRYEQNIRQERHEAMRDFEEFLRSVEDWIEMSDEAAMLSVTDKEAAMRICDAHLEWLKTHPLAEPMEVEQKHKDATLQLREYYGPLYDTD